MSHLGDRIPALVDGELDHDARDRTLAHLTRCPECRAEVELERRTKALLTRLTTPEPSAELMRGLLTLAEPGPPLPPSRRPFPRGDRPPTVSPPARRRPAGAPAEGRRPGGRSHHRLRVITVGALSGFAIVMGTAFVAGGQPEEPGVPLTPPIDRYRVEHAATTGVVPFVDPAYATFSGTFQPAFSNAGMGPGSIGWTGASIYGVPSR